jgi:predicted nucleic acid-binding protein
MADTPSLEKRTFLLDTNILQDLSTPYRSEKTLGLLLSLLGRGNRFVISDFAIYELLRGATLQKEKEASESVGRFERHNITPDVLLAAAWLDTIYRMEKVEAGISDGDEILAATAILTTHAVITRDYSGFPSPFFKEVHREVIVYERKHRPQSVAVLFLEPDLDFISGKFKERRWQK